MMNRSVQHFVRLTALSVMFAAGLAVAAPPSDPNTPPPHRQPSDAPLGGPRVHDRDVPGHTAKFGEMDDKRMRAARVPIRIFMASVKDLTSEETPAELRLTGAQQESIDAIEKEMGEFQRSMARQRRAENGGRAPDAKAPGRPDAPDQQRARQRPQRAQDADGMAPEGAPGPQRRQRVGPGVQDGAPPVADDKRRARAQEMMNFEPPPEIEAMRIRAWEVLTEPQQEFVRERIQQRMEEVRARMQERTPDGAPAAGPGPGAGPEGDQNPRAQRLRERAQQMSPQEILALIEKLPPERQARALERFRRYLEQEMGADKPAPEMDEVEVPAP